MSPSGPETKQTADLATRRESEAFAAEDSVAHEILGSYVRIYWTCERRWFRGVVASITEESGRRLHKICYDDGDVQWHHLPSECWTHAKKKSSEAKAKTSKRSKLSKRPMVLAALAVSTETTADAACALAVATSTTAAVTDAEDAFALLSLPVDLVAFVLSQLAPRWLAGVHAVSRECCSVHAPAAITIAALELGIAASTTPTLPLLQRAFEWAHGHLVPGRYDFSSQTSDALGTVHYAAKGHLILLPDFTCSGGTTETSDEQGTLRCKIKDGRWTPDGAVSCRPRGLEPQRNQRQAWAFCRICPLGMQSRSVVPHVPRRCAYLRPSAARGLSIPALTPLAELP